MLQVENIYAGYGDDLIVKKLSFQMKKGEILGVLGPNGSGKSTLLKVISGVLPAKSGSITIDGKSAKRYTPKEFARKVAVLPQLHAHTFSHSVGETVSLGRYPHQSGLFSTWSQEDEHAVNEAMSSTAVTRYKEQSIELLSGGEQQRVFVAQALAQQAPILLLDEPTNHLDIAHQQQLLDTICAEAVNKELTVLAVFHDINLAALYCDRLLLMKDGQITKIGTPQEVIEAGAIEEAYGARVKTQAHPEQAKPQITLLPKMNNKATQALELKKQLSVNAKQTLFQAKQPLKTLSNARHNGGFGWYQTFVNQYVEDSSELIDELKQTGLSLTDTVGMQTMLATQYVETAIFTEDFVEVLVVVQVTSSDTKYQLSVWIIVNGKLADEAFTQVMITAIEAKMRARLNEGHLNYSTKDQILIAATQEGSSLIDAETNTILCQKIAEGVEHCTNTVIKRIKEEERE